MKDIVQKEGISDFYQVNSQLATGTCSLLINGIHRSLVANLSAANTLNLDHFLKAPLSWAIEKTKYFYASGFILTVCPDALVHVGKHASENGKMFFFYLSAPFLSEFFGKQMMQVLPYADVVFGNELEAQAFAKANQIPNEPSLQSSIMREKLSIFPLFQFIRH